MLRFRHLRSWLIVVGLMLMLSGAAAQEPTPTPMPGPTLNSVLARGEVNCAVNQSLLGFGYLDPNTGEVHGFDVDLCRALAAAIFGDTNAVNLVLFDSEPKAVAALAAGEADVLLRNVVWKPSLDNVPGLAFGPVTFYSGQSFMVAADSGLNDWPDLSGHTICLVENSTAAVTLGPVMLNRGLAYQPVTLPTLAEAQTAFTEGRCDAYSSDRVLLEIFRQRLPDPTGYHVWADMAGLYTHEPYAPLYRSDDDQWANIVNWTILGLIQAEQQGLRSETMAGLLRLPDEEDEAYRARVTPAVAALVDSELGVGAALGLKANFIVPAIQEVGNYGEIYQRHFGPMGELPLERGPNRLAKDGGLIYAPDWR